MSGVTREFVEGKAKAQSILASLEPNEFGALVIVRSNAVEVTALSCCCVTSCMGVLTEGMRVLAEELDEIAHKERR